MKKRYKVNLDGKSADSISYYFTIDGTKHVLDFFDACHLIMNTPEQERNCVIEKSPIIAMRSENDSIKIIPDPERDKKIASDPMRIDLVSSHTAFNNVITVHDLFFLKHVVGCIDLFQDDKKPLETIDHAEIIAIKENTKQVTIKTPLGITSIANLSTGCKSVYNAKFLRKHFPNEDWELMGDTLGDNVFPFLFKEIAGSKMKVYISFDIDIDFIMDSPYHVYFNGRPIHNTLELLDLFGILIWYDCNFPAFSDKPGI